jgi:anti-repressor protein
MSIGSADLLGVRSDVRRDFSTWIKDRIAEYGFVEGEDFSPVSGKTSRRGGRPATDYHLSLDMAKELTMRENND